MVGPEIPDGGIGIDIGPATIAAYSEIIEEAGTVVWNGPMGKFEDEPFRPGHPRRRAGHGRSAGVTVVGGGETAEAVERFGFADKVSPRLDRRRGVPRMPRREIVQLAPR